MMLKACAIILTAELRSILIYSTGISAISVDNESDDFYNMETIPPPSPYRNKPQPQNKQHPQHIHQQSQYTSTQPNGYIHDSTDYTSAVTQPAHNFSNHIGHYPEPLYSQPYQTWKNQLHFSNQQQPYQHDSKLRNSGFDDDGYRIVRVCKPIASNCHRGYPLNLELSITLLN